MHLTIRLKGSIYAKHIAINASIKKISGIRVKLNQFYFMLECVALYPTLSAFHSITRILELHNATFRKTIILELFAAAYFCIDFT